jgi:hypothetical protein
MHGRTRKKGKKLLKTANLNEIDEEKFWHDDIFGRFLPLQRRSMEI